MIPQYLQGKSAIEICNEVKKRFIGTETGDIANLYERYEIYLEGLLLLAVKDALCNADPVAELIAGIDRGPEQRAIAFLNMVLPYENKT